MIEAGLHIGGLACIAILIVAYALVLYEESIHLRKSKPVMLAAGLIWLIIGIIAPGFGVSHAQVHDAAIHILGEFAALMMFLLPAMTYISALQDRNVFAALKDRMTRGGLTYRQLFWITGFMAFYLSPVMDNLTTALVMGAVVLALGADNPKFVALSCINIVSAANAGGAFSPFGDITTLMVWQAGKLELLHFFSLFLPALANFLVPAFIMSHFLENKKPKPVKDKAVLKPGAKRIIGLGVITIAMAVGFEHFYGLPPFFGMMTGLSLLMVTSWFITNSRRNPDTGFNIFSKIAAVEWDTMLFFFGIIFCLSGIGFLGYLQLASNTLYEGMGPGATNIAMGLASAVIDNIPIMFAVLTMNPHMDHFQWLLITLTTGIGGTLLSIGSAAGVALMGVARGQYTFMSHLRWTPVLLIGYAAAIVVHYTVNSYLIGH